MRELTQRQAASPETTSIPQPEWFEHKALGYAIAIAGTALSALLRWGLGQTVGHQIPPYITFYPAVILSALVGGTGPGLLATLLSALTVDLCFLGPFGRFGIVHSADAVGLGLFGLINIAMSVVGGRLRAARLKIRADARRAMAQANQLDQFVRLLDLANVLVRDADDRIIRWNEGCARLYGITAEQATGRISHDLLQTRFPEPLETIRQTLRRTGRWEGELTHRCANGQCLTVASVWLLHRVEPGGGTVVLEVNNDITDRKKAERLLQADEQRLRLATEGTGVGVWDLDVASGLIECSPQIKALWQMPPDTPAYFSDWEARLHPEDRTRVLEAYQRTLDPAGSGQQAIEYRAIMADGTVRWLAAQAMAQFVETHGQRQVARIVGTLIDITERKQAEEALRESEERFRGTFENAAVGIAHLDAEGRFLRVNEKLRQILGCQCHELRGLNFRSLTDPQTLEPDSSSYGRLVRGEITTYSVEERYLRRDGQAAWVSVTRSLQRDPAGKPAYSIAIVEDIGDRKRTEQALRELNDTLEQRVAERTAELERRLEQLRTLTTELTLAEHRERQRIAKVLHDHLQQLLVGAKFNIATMLIQAADPELRQSLSRVDRLLEESVQASRTLTAELFPLILHTGTFGQALRWLIQWMKEKHDLQVHFKTDDSVDLKAEEVRLLLFEATRELLFNIVKHAGVREACLEMVTHDTHFMRITIADSGKGFDTSLLHPTNRTEGGFGMVSIRERLGLVGGRVEIDSTPGRGTRATLLAPLAADATHSAP